MSISVKYFASIREKVGKSDDIVEFTRACSVADIWSQTSPGARPANLLVAVNEQYVSWDHAVTDGDEVAFFPPVTGG